MEAGSLADLCITQSLVSDEVAQHILSCRRQALIWDAYRKDRMARERVKEFVRRTTELL